MSEDSALGSAERELSPNPSESVLKYEYEPLPTSPATIRLCKIQPPSTPLLEEPVSCEIHHFDLDTAARMKYRALSYAWGEPNLDQTITLNGSWFNVTSHLCKALQRLRSCGFQWVWVDAICIDQSNIPERNAQVSLMGRIYSLTECAAIYLGEANLQEARAVGLMMHLSALLKLRRGLGANDTRAQLTDEDCLLLINGQGQDHAYVKECKSGGIEQVRSAVSDLLRVLNLPDGEDSLWDALTSIYRRPWFGRGWVLQEAVLPDQAIVILGDVQFEFEKLESCIVFLHNSGLFHHGIVLLPLQAIAPMAIKKIREKSENRNLIHLLRRLYKSQTTDPRDKIYSLLGIADDVSMVPRPDYSQSVEAIYRSYAMHFITNCEGLSLLRYSGIANGASRANTTWVPRWDCWSPERTVDQTMDESKLFQACAGRKSQFVYEEETSLLRVRGVRFDVAGRFCSQTYWSDFHKDWVSWERGISNIVSHSPRFSTESYARALVMQGNGHGIEFLLQTSTTPETFVSLYKSLLLTPPVINGNHLIYMGHITETAEFHRFVLTSRGYLGWVPKESKPSDTICVIFGVNVPLVLREVEDGRHILIGNAYIEGIMGGEAMNDESLVAEEFILA